LTVLVPFYNPGDFLRDAVDSVFRQTLQDWSLVLIDDGSTDESLESIRHRLGDPRITVIRSETNRGQSVSLNRGLEQVRSEFFLQLDADDWLEDHAAERFLSVAETAPEDVALVISNVIEVNWETGEKRIIRQPKWGKRYANRYQILLANLFPWQKFYRTSAIRAIGGWPREDESRNIEDLGIFLRLIEKYGFIWVDEALFNYRKHGQNMTDNREAVAAGVEWEIRGALKRWGGRYEPIFVTTPDGWRMLGGLIAPKEQR
jgi:glycosyltransferase involved in cell wall biosynthesis